MTIKGFRLPGVAVILLSPTNRFYVELAYTYERYYAKIYVRACKIHVHSMNMDVSNAPVPHVELSLCFSSATFWIRVLCMKIEPLIIFKCL